MNFLYLLLLVSGAVLANALDDNLNAAPVPKPLAHIETAKTQSEDTAHSSSTAKQIPTESSKEEHNSSVSTHHPTQHSESSTVTSTTSASITVKPTPADNVGNWSVYYEHTHNPCIRIWGIIQLNVTEEKPNKTDHYSLYVPPSANVTGSCEITEPYIRFYFSRISNSSLQFKFALNKTAHPESFKLHVIDGEIFFPNSKTDKVGFQQSVDAFVTPLNNSYKCGTSKNFTLKETKKDKVELFLHNFQIQAFKNSTAENFDTAIDGCPPEHVTPDVVPIVVGCALAVLVISVLVAYLISRRRSQARGYLSM